MKFKKVYTFLEAETLLKHVKRGFNNYLFHNFQTYVGRSLLDIVQTKMTINF